MLAINLIIPHLSIETLRLYKGGGHEDGKWEGHGGKVMDSEVGGLGSCWERARTGLEREPEGLG